MTAAGTGGRTAIVVKGYPRLSETFIAQEIHGLQERGLQQLIVSLRRPTDPDIHPVHRRITAPVLYLPEYLHDEPWRVFRGFAHARHYRGYQAALHALLRDLRHEPTRNRLRRFGQACVLARELPADVGWLHCHYLHTPASVTRYAALIRGLGWSFSAHAKDIWTTPARELAEKMGSAGWGVTCTAGNLAYLRSLSPRPEAIALIYHGLDLSAFPDPVWRPPRDGLDPHAPVQLLSVGRAVEKKGFDDLLHALARLPPRLHWRWTHIGGGERLTALQRQAESLGLAGRIAWLGPQTHDAVITACLEADLFVLPAKVARSGDRDGLPNVLMEAQATGLACLSTAVSAIPELIDDGVTGRLVASADPAALAAALAALIGDPSERSRLGAAGAERVRRDFRFETGLDRLVQKLFGMEEEAGYSDSEASRRAALLEIIEP
ncbi:MAG: glycosyltransferase [Alphaproteobacteria bacterium]|jgi:glycosyltransferase involved in cell wall biosynthesis|nr:glycosyltransferase [Alphaproteobacteria bacterium]